MAWHLLYCKAKQEFKARDKLIDQKGKDKVYFPRVENDKRENKKHKYSPLFPRYGFIDLTPGIDDFSPISNTPGVSCLVKGPGGFLVASDRQINELIARETASGVHHIAIDYIAGDQVRIISGPYNGYERLIHAVEEERIWVFMGDMVLRLKYTDVEAINA